MAPWYRPYVVSIILREQEAARPRKGRATLLFVAVCVGALAFVAGMSMPLP